MFIIRLLYEHTLYLDVLLSVLPALIDPHHDDKAATMHFSLYDIELLPPYKLSVVTNRLFVVCCLLLAAEQVVGWLQLAFLQYCKHLPAVTAVTLKT